MSMLHRSQFVLSNKPFYGGAVLSRNTTILASRFGTTKAAEVHKSEFW